MWTQSTPSPANRPSCRRGRGLSEHSCCSLGEADRRGEINGIVGVSLSLPQGPSTDRAVGVERVKIAGELGEEPLAGALAAADAAHV